MRCKKCKCQMDEMEIEKALAELREAAEKPTELGEYEHAKVYYRCRRCGNIEPSA